MKAFLLVAFLMIGGRILAQSYQPQTDSAVSEFDSLVWFDEFDGDGRIDTTKWFHQTQLPSWGSWFGGLINHYTDREQNTFVKDGLLNLVAIKESFTDQGQTKEYTSARLNSRYAFTYGKVEIRAKMPFGKGTWPAIWMLNRNINEAGAYWERKGYGTTSWPTCGEIDILEHWGDKQDVIQSAVHNGSSYGGKVINYGSQKVESTSTDFHIYSFEWSKDKMIFGVDGMVHYVYQPKVKDASTWPYDDLYYFLLNIAIESDIDPEFKKSAMQVDYIRVYQ